MNDSKKLLLIAFLAVLGLFHLKNETPLASIFASVVPLSTPSQPVTHSTFPLMLPIEKIFETLHGHQVEEAYQTYTSIGFKRETSLQTFQQFIEGFPIFTHEKLVNYHSPMVQEGIGNVIVELKNEKQELITLDILLINEDKVWKILGLQVLPNAPHSEFKEMKADEAKDLALKINRTLKAFANGDLERSYQQETSSDFKKGTPFLKFKELVVHHPVLTQHTDIHYSKLTFHNNIATYGIYLNDAEGNSHYMEYDFVKEHHHWKILQMLITGP